MRDGVIERSSPDLSPNIQTFIEGRIGFVFSDRGSCSVVFCLYRPISLKKYWNYSFFIQMNLMEYFLYCMTIVICVNFVLIYISITLYW